MELFSITCTTCHARLKVRDPSVIGHILACPKCHSMVMIEPPPGWQPPDEMPAAAGVSSYDSPDQSGITIPSRNRDSSAVATTQSVKQHSEQAAPVTATAAATERPIMPSDEWVSPATQRMRYWLMLGGGAATGVALAIGLIAIVVNWYSKSAAPSKAVATASDDKNLVAKERPTTNPTQPSNTPPVEPPDDSVTPVDKVDNMDDSSITDASPTTELPKTDDPPVTPINDKTVPNPDEPPDLVPDSGDASPDAPKDAGSLLEGLRDFTELLDEPTIRSSDPSGESVGADIDATDLPDEVGGEDPLPRPEPREVDVALMLTFPVQGIELKEVALAEFVQFVSDLSTIPITIEPEALAHAGVSPTTPVSIKQVDTTIAGMLTGVLEPRGLAFEATDGHLLITRPGPADGSLRKVTYDVADLTGGDRDRLTALADTLTAVVAPNSWEANEGIGVITWGDNSLIIEQTEPVHFQILAFCEKLRVARGLSTRSSLPPERFKLEQRTQLAQAKLQTPVSANYIQPVRFVEVLSRIGKQAGVNILVDWEMAATVGWSPEAKVPFSADKQPLSDALNALLRRMELTYRVVDADTIQITTPTALLERAELEFYSVGAFLTEKMDDKRLIERIKATLGAVHFFAGAGAIRYDAASQCLLVYLPQPEQNRLANLLSEWQKTES